MVCTDVEVFCEHRLFVLVLVVNLMRNFMVHFLDSFNVSRWRWRILVPHYAGVAVAYISKDAVHG